MTRPCRIVPAILTSDVEALRTMVRQVEDFASYAQFDFMDGHFVPSRSVNDKDLASIPIKFEWEAHLMVENPAESFTSLKRLGASRVIFHYEATPSPEEVIRQARELSLAVGVALNPDTPVSAVIPLVNKLDSILFMTVVPGFYGSKFQPQVMEKIAEFRRKYPTFDIGADGGINAANIAMVASAGVDEICVGSGIFLQPSPIEAYHLLKSLVEGASARKRN